ncbi:MAG: signal recognition particle-docking protein FtsY [Symplocastrum torsivum CPER-KK1]|jgi:fused signal recognition particle receptor|uniref:Signal recognition particle receptor FtsY n=1 Tax=Symplocastrum torsivum CPER-KK1 TaxID=450513 RepID=A0A951U896_9CYAN|nr:signal recognition particle-docking protein FtsY [Symplocastrum torsivum CPER-KK1]
MVFNWFRRQIGKEGEKPLEETPQVEQEKQASEQPDVKPAESTEAQTQAVAEDYLSWAKAAYKNIQKQQQSVEPETTATEPPASETVEEQAPEAAIETSVPSIEVTDTPQLEETTKESAPTETAQPTEAATPETPAILSEPELDAAVAEDTASIEPVVTEAELEATATVEAPEIPADSEPTESQDNLVVPSEESVETPTAEAPVLEEETATSEAATDSGDESVAVSSEEPVVTTGMNSEAEPVIAAPLAVESEAESSSASIPIWARQSNAERQARLERLKATAIEIPEPEPVRAAVQQAEPAATTTVEAGEVPGLAFDEGFLWSAEVLAAQGRRPEDVSLEEISWLKRLRQGLDKTRRSLVNQLKAIVGQGPLNQDAVMEIEALLLQADVGVEATDYIINTLQQRLREEVLPPEQAIAYLKQILRDLLDRPCQESYSPNFAPEKDTLNIWLITGVNGAGKTTTIGKLAHLGQKSGYHCLIGAADTFRAAAVEQVKVWGQRSGTEVIANPGKNTDPAAVVFDAIAAAQSRDVELLLVDTAGRLQNKKNLMEELAKIRRIVDKKAPNAKVESLLVLDATLGQNGLRQAEVFSQAAKLSGVVLTKLDGTAKGGVALAVVQELGLPIRFIGAGEGIEDLRPFSSYEFVEALLNG